MARKNQLDYLFLGAATGGGSGVGQVDDTVVVDYDDHATTGNQGFFREGYYQPHEIGHACLCRATVEVSHSQIVRNSGVLALHPNQHSMYHISKIMCYGPLHYFLSPFFIFLLVVVLLFFFSALFTFFFTEEAETLSNMSAMKKGGKK